MGFPSVVAAVARADYETAQQDLGATRTQAAAVTANAMALRLTAVAVPVAVVGVLVLLIGTRLAFEDAFVVVPLALVIPWGVTFILSFPLLTWATLQTWWRGSREERLRFGLTNTVYLYYGWRYAFRGRRRAWGALSLAEKRQANPARAARYWPNDADE